MRQLESKEKTTRSSQGVEELIDDVNSGAFDFNLIRPVPSLIHTAIPVSALLGKSDALTMLYLAIFEFILVLILADLIWNKALKAYSFSL